MTDVEKRFYRYISIDTTSADDAGCYPSTPNQMVLAHQLKDELLELGLADATVDEYGYVMATIPGNVDHEVPVIGLLAHMDTSNAVSGADIKARTFLYEGGDILLNEQKQIWLKVDEYPELENYIGQHLIVSDGTTLLGADDKAGVAEIMTATAWIMAHPEVPHGDIRVGFTPDEEVGCGTDYFSIEKFGAQYAYTVDGGALGDLEYDNFNAATANVHIHGVSMHPGSSKGRMVNAILIAMELQGMLPVEQRPEYTEGHEGFYHLHSIEGDVENCKMEFIIRDHSSELFQFKKARMETIAAYLNEKYGEGVVELSLKDSYYNMKEIIEKYPFMMEYVKAAYHEAGVETVEVPIRGGTDGVRLSYMGLPCPNLSTGGHNFHSVLEFVPRESMDAMVQVLVNLVQKYV